MTTIKETYDSIALITKEFKFKANRNSYSCSGLISLGTFKAIVNYVESQKGKTHLEVFKALSDEKFLNTLITPLDYEKIKVGNLIEIDKLGTCTILSLEKNNVQVYCAKYGKVTVPYHII